MKKLPLKIRYSCEQRFAEILIKQGKKFIYQPAKFNVNSISYTPDFYIPEERTFYEVAGTRQAHSRNRKQIKLIKKVYPFIRIKVVNPDGSNYKSHKLRSLPLEEPKSNLLFPFQPINMSNPELKFPYINKKYYEYEHIIKEIIELQQSQKLAFSDLLLLSKRVDPSPYRRGISGITLYKILASENRNKSINYRIQYILKAMLLFLREKHHKKPSSQPVSKTRVI